MADFSMELNEDQQHVLQWVHDFARDVVRPAAHEWDEREETPWPIIEEASKIGLYSFDFIANCYADPSGLLLALVSEELAWGDAGQAEHGAEDGQADTGVAPGHLLVGDR